MREPIDNAGARAKEEDLLKLAAKMREARLREIEEKYRAGNYEIDVPALASRIIDEHLKS